MSRHVTPRERARKRDRDRGEIGYPAPNCVIDIEGTKAQKGMREDMELQGASMYCIFTT
jgi:hypothetical protein